MLRAFPILASLVLLSHSVQSEPAPEANTEVRQYSPFVAPYAKNKPIFLFKRQSCPADHTSCSNLNAPDACCPSGTNCARDSKGTIACCPVNNVCTGIIGQTSITSGSVQQTQQTSVPGGFVGTVTVTSIVEVSGGSTITTPIVTGGGVAGGGSTVQNAYYPFVYMPTSFANAAICSQYYTSCQTASTACFQSLAGANGVTVGGIAGGTTQVGSTGVIQASASSICSSLSRNACYGVRTEDCGHITASGSGFVQVNRGPRETGCPAMVYVAAAGAAALVL